MSVSLFCGVCGYSNTSQPLLKCKSCNLRVHSDCIGGKNGIHSLCSSWNNNNNNDSWECISCTVNQKDATCCLCLVDEAERSTNENQLYLMPTSEEAWMWVHSCCSNIEHNLVLNSNEIKNKPLCEFCNSSDYQLVTCFNKKDKKESYFHVSCAVLYGYDKGYNITRIGISNPHLSENDKEINDLGIILTINYSSNIPIDKNENRNSSITSNSNNFLVSDIRTNKNNENSKKKLNSSSNTTLSVTSSSSLATSLKKKDIKYNFMHYFGSIPNRCINSKLTKLYGSFLLFNDLNNLDSIIWTLTTDCSDANFNCLDLFQDMNNIVIASVLEDENANIKYLSSITSLTNVISKRINNWETLLMVNKVQPLANKIKDMIIKNNKDINKALLNSTEIFFIAHNKKPITPSIHVLNNHLSRSKGSTSSKLCKITNDIKIKNNNNNNISESKNNNNNVNNNNKDDNIINNNNDSNIDNFLNILINDPEFKKISTASSINNQESNTISPRFDVSKTDDKSKSIQKSNKPVAIFQKSNKCGDDKYSFTGCPDKSKCRYTHDALNRNLDLKTRKEIILKELLGLGYDDSSIDNIIESKCAEIRKEFEDAAVLRNRLIQIIFAASKENHGEGISESELEDNYYSVYNERVNYPILIESNCIITLEEILKNEKNVTFAQSNKYIYTGATTWFSIPPEVPSKFKALEGKSFLDIIDNSTKRKEIDLKWNNNNNHSFNFEEKVDDNFISDKINDFDHFAYIEAVAAGVNVNDNPSSNSNSWMLCEDGTILPPLPSEPDNLPPPPPPSDSVESSNEKKRVNYIVKSILFPCSGYNSHVGCTLGDKCNFSHDKPSLTATFLNNNDISRSSSLSSLSSFNNNNNNNENNVRDSWDSTSSSKVSNKAKTSNNGLDLWESACAWGSKDSTWGNDNNNSDGTRNNNDSKKNISRSNSNSGWGTSSSGWTGEFSEWENNTSTSIFDKNNKKRKLDSKEIDDNINLNLKKNEYKGTRKDDWECPNKSCPNSKSKICFGSKPNCRLCGSLNPNFKKSSSNQGSKKKVSSPPSHYLPNDINISDSTESDFTPRSKRVVKKNSNNQKCRYGKDCHREDCYFEH